VKQRQHHPHLQHLSLTVCWLVTQVFVPSKDGTVKIPMFIVASKNVTLDGQNPAFLYAYGGAIAFPCH
jgi:prolyl oligopeptidase PreP (S9A serine peptidase family)